MSIYKGKNRIATGGVDYELSDDLSQHSLSFIDDGDCSAYDSYDQLAAEITSDSLIGNLISKIKKTLSYLHKKILEADSKFLKLTGGNLSGNVHIIKYLPSVVLSETDESKGISFVQKGTNNIFLAASNDSTYKDLRRVVVFNSASNVPIENSLVYHDYIDGSYKGYKIYGEHNRDSIVLGSTLTMFDGVRNQKVLQCLDDGDNYNYGCEVILSGRGNMYVGSGESAESLYSVNGSSNGEVMYITSDGNVVIAPNCNTIANRKPIWITAAAMYPNTSGSHTLGTSTYKWGQIYSTTASISTSDRNQKNSICDLDDKAIDLILKLPTTSFKFNDGTSDRRHWGMIAQDVEDLMNELEISTQDFAGFIKSPKEKCNDCTGELELDLDENGDVQYEYGLRYEEFIAPLIKTVQKQQEEINELKQILKNKYTN